MSDTHHHQLERDLNNRLAEKLDLVVRDYLNLWIAADLDRGDGLANLISCFVMHTASMLSTTGMDPHDAARLMARAVKSRDDK